MPAVRVFLLTCRRPVLLPRALASLRAQTFTDWICELHNDAPEDDYPGRLLAEIADPRITLHQHTKNWGAVAAFNHAFTGGPEPFATLLEDDNWWEPDFLSAAVAALERTPSANAAWANLRLWQENLDGTWRDTHRTIWQTHPDDFAPRLFRWPVPLQTFDALHSNGALLYRTTASRTALVPPNIPFDIIEPVRERLISGDWLFLPQPLANFALTLQTSRSGDRADWLISQLLVAASYQLSVHPARTEIAALWNVLREQQPPTTNLLFHLACAGVRPCALLAHARHVDWFRFLRGALRHPLVLWRGLHFRTAHANLWPSLLAASRARTQEASAQAHQSSPNSKPLKKDLRTPHAAAAAPTSSKRPLR